MDRLAKLVTAALLLGVGAAHAGYAQLAPPAGFGGSAGNWTFAPSANDVRYGGTAYSPNALRVPGTSATMPAAFRFAANAPRIAAAAIFMNPYVRAGVGIATWLGIAGIIWDAVNQKWVVPGDEYPVSTGTRYLTNPQGTGQQYNTAVDACKAMIAGGAFGGTGWLNPKFVGASETTCFADVTHPVDGSHMTDQRIIYSLSGNANCPSGWYVTPAGCVQTPPMKEVGKEQFEDLLTPKPMPDTVPWELPKPTPLPVEQPVINPDAVPNPVPRPLFVPTGDPVSNPQYDPNAAPGPDNQPWIQPGVRVNPSPTPSEPWRVDLQPVNRPVPGSEPMPEPDSETPPDGDKPREEQTDFCVKNPDVLACQKLDEPNSEELPASEKPISISPDGGWGADNASCPAPKQITVQGRAIPIPFDLFCTWASGMRPIIIAMAWLSAAFILLGARNES